MMKSNYVSLSSKMRAIRRSLAITLYRIHFSPFYGIHRYSIRSAQKVSVNGWNDRDVIATGKPR
jgi:hypothetical protein